MRLPLYLALLTPLFITPAGAAWPRLPSHGDQPVGMEMAHGGTAISAVSGLQSPEVLLSGNPTQAATLLPGLGELTFKLAAQEVLKQVSFVAEAIDGKITLAISSDLRSWTSVGSQVIKSQGRLVKFDLGRAQGRYVRLQFETAKGGKVRAIQLLGNQDARNFAVRQAEGAAGAPVNFASGIGGGKLVYLSENIPGRCADAAMSNHFTFVNGGEKVAVYDLGQVREMTEFGSVHSATPVTVKVYAFDALPEKENWRGRVTFDSAVLGALPPVAVGEDQRGKGVAVVKAMSSVKARFVAIKWEMSSGGPFEVFGVALSGIANVYFQNGEYTATTFTGENGQVVTRLRTGASLEASADDRLSVWQTQVAPVQRATSTAMLAWNPAGGTAGSGAVVGAPYAGKQRGTSAAGSLLKDEVELEPEAPVDPDEDPPSVDIPWCVNPTPP